VTAIVKKDVYEVRSLKKFQNKYIIMPPTFVDEICKMMGIEASRYSPEG